MTPPTASNPTPSMTFDLSAWMALPVQHRAITLVLALGAGFRPRTWVTQQLNTQAQTAVLQLSQRFPPDDVLVALQSLQKAGWVEQEAQRYNTAELWRLRPAAVAVVYPMMFVRASVQHWRQWLAEADGYAARHGQITLYSPTAAIALARLEALAGCDKATLVDLTQRFAFSMSSDEVLALAVGEVIDLDLLPMLDVSVQSSVLTTLVSRQVSTLQRAPFDVAPVVAEFLEAETEAESWDLRLIWGQWLVLNGQSEAVQAVLAPLPTPEQAAPKGADPLSQAVMALATRAMARAQAGHWLDAEALFEEALQAYRSGRGARARRGLGSIWASTLYVMTLLRLGGAERQERALKFCIHEGGKREPVPEAAEGIMALAIQVRQGDRGHNERMFWPNSLRTPFWLSMLDMWCWLMRAWLKTGTEPTPLSPRDLDAYTVLHERLASTGLLVPARWLENARAALEARQLPADFFIQSAQAGWQSTLEALQALVNGDSQAQSKAASVLDVDIRLLWGIHLASDGSVQDLTPYEQKRLIRGWGRPKAVALSRFHRSPSPLEVEDARLIAALRQDPNSRLFRLDLSEALPALVGHPRVVIAPALDTLVELIEAIPELDVSPLPARAGQPEGIRVRMVPYIDPTGGLANPGVMITSAAHQREVDALQCIRILPDNPQRARLYRLNAAQRRVALLLGLHGLSLPKEGLPQLEPILAGLGAHFQIHSDASPVQASIELPVDSRLRAELQPQGDGLMLRLVAAPFGEQHPTGPRPIPGQGRARLVVNQNGETWGVQRDLDAETAQLEAVLDACPVLSPPPPGSPCEWSLETPEEALVLLECLPTLSALQGIDWPKGQPVRVDRATLGQLHINVHTRRQWFELEGKLQVDEQLVLGLQQLLQLIPQQRSRFVPLGKDRYLALTQELRERLDDLAAVTEPGSRGDSSNTALHAPIVAAPWLEQATIGTQLATDTAFRQNLARLETARTVVPSLPGTLQASLRPYQEEGFEWAMRLAHAGFGACLADDMGLGKTLQALAVLLARSALGPALVIAPTSLLGNWQSEASKFAPSLTVHSYAEGGSERMTQLATLGAGHIVLASYQMVQIDQAAFAARSWATLVLDEAQAIKNATAKRSQAVFELVADFRLALSGTPIENRLTELWSIMRACNPGLLGTAQQFGERFVGPIERQRDRGAQRLLRRLIAPFVLRRTKSQVLPDLPSRTELVYEVEPDAVEQAHYEALRRDVLATTEANLAIATAGAAHLNVLAGLTRLRRAACDPRLINPQFSAIGAKVKAFGELAAELVANGHKALVFSQFVDFLALLKEPLDAAGIPYQYLDGSTSATERTRRVDDFQAGYGELFLISLKAGGFGLNLTVADYVVIADPWWNPAAEDQAMGRAHRMGQQRPVTVYRLVTQGTLEDKIIALHQHKRELADQLLEGQETAVIPDAQALLALMRNDGS